MTDFTAEVCQVVADGSPIARSRKLMVSLVKRAPVLQFGLMVREQAPVQFYRSPEDHFTQALDDLQVALAEHRRELES